MSAEQLSPLEDGRGLFQIRGNSFTLLTLRVNEPMDQHFFMHLGKFVSQAPNLYRNAPIVLDLAPLADREPFNMADFIRRLRQHQLNPVGVQNAAPAWERVAVNAGLGVFPSGRATNQLPPPQPQYKPEPAAQPAPKAGQGHAHGHGHNHGQGHHGAPNQPAKPPAARPAGARIVSEAVRSGQQLYAAGGDLIVLGPVSHGAELLADGNIHVYGTLRGRALAGLKGDIQARIFCRTLEAELICVAGVYMVSEQIKEDYGRKPVQIRLDGENLVIDPIV